MSEFERLMVKAKAAAAKCPPVAEQFSSDLLRMLADGDIDGLRRHVEAFDAQCKASGIALPDMGLRGIVARLDALPEKEET